VQLRNYDIIVNTPFSEKDQQAAHLQRMG